MVIIKFNLNLKKKMKKKKSNIERDEQREGVSEK
jgi:hypothetical protein